MRQLITALVLFLSACHRPLPPDVHIAKLEGVTITSLAEAFVKRTRTLTIDWGPMGNSEQVALAQVLSYSGKAPSITAPLDWNLIRDDSSQGTTRQSLYWHRIQSGEPSAQTWSFSQRVDAEGVILLLDGLARISPLDVSSGKDGGGINPIPPSLVTTYDGDLVLAFYASDFGPEGLGVKMPPKMYSVVDQTSAQREYWIVGARQVHQGKVDGASAQTVQLSNWVAALVALRTEK